MKDNISRKKYMEIWYFLQMFWKDGFFKKIVMEYDLSSIIWKDGIFFPENKILGRKWKMIFLKKYMEICFFLYMRTDVTKMMWRPSAKNKSKMIFPQKNTL